MSVKEYEYGHSVFHVYLIYYFYNLKARGDLEKWTSDSESASKNTLMK